MSTFGTPVVTEMQVIPVAGYDSMLMTLSGAHAPWFTRNIVILKDSAGHTGIGEIHGGDYTCDALTSVIPLVVESPSVLTGPYWTAYTGPAKSLMRMTERAYRPLISQSSSLW